MTEDGLDRAPSRELSHLWRIWRFLRPYGWQIAAASIALIVTAGVTLSIGQGMRMVIDSGFASGSREVLVQSVMVFAALVVLLTAGTFVRFYFVSWIGERVSADLRFEVFAHLLRLHPGFFEQNLPTEIQSRITTDTTLLQNVIGSSVSIALRNMLMFVGGVVLLFVTNAKLTSVVLISVPFVVAPIVLFGRKVRMLSRTSQDRLADVGTYAGESFRHIKVVQSFRHEAVDEQRFGERVADAFRVAIHRVRQRALLIALVMLLVMAAIATMVWIGGSDVLAGGISAGELAAFIFYAFIVAGSVGAISEVYADLQRAAGATERLLELLQAQPAIEDPEDAQLLSSGMRSVAMEAVEFAYPTRREVTVLRGVNFQVEAGEMVAIVGPSGAGKSTLFDLLQRFYDPTAGVVTMNGVDLRRLSLASIRDAIGFVPQDAVLFSGSLRENLRYARVDATDTQIWEALELANASAFVRALPQGLDTVLGEGGSGLSGGQRQRIAIARALLGRPGLILLDEATSALDAESEQAIRNTIDQLKGQHTVIVIAHRLSTVRQADRIIVLDEGRVSGVGPHEALLRTSALYARFCQVQFADSEGPDAREVGDEVPRTPVARG